MLSDHIRPLSLSPLFLTPSDSFILPNKFYLHVCFGSCKPYSGSHAWLHPFMTAKTTPCTIPRRHCYIVLTILSLLYSFASPSIMFAGPWGRWYKCLLSVCTCKCYQFSVLSPVNHLSTTKISFSKQGWKWPWTDCLNINIQKAVFHVYLLKHQ